MATKKRIVREMMPCINIIQGSETKENLVPVAAYARVSTEKEEQEDSFERQVEHYTQMISENPKWCMVEVYADPGISGTRAEKRPNFMRMIQDCRDGKIKRILVKSISRFARNTVDALKYIRELRDLNISVFFENENIDTLGTGGDVLITILAAMAEQESRTISTNIKWAWQRKFQNGEIILNTGLMLGYTKLPKKDENGYDVYVINEKEAKIIRRIYEEFIAGATLQRICSGLEEDGIRTKLGKEKWSPAVIQSILSNEKYTGNAILGKTFKQDVLTKNRQKNDGSMAPMYYAENSHPAIIDPEVFELARKELEQRKAAKGATVNSSRYTSKYPFSGMLICGNCGCRLRRHLRTMGAGNKVASWGCTNRIKNGRSECDSHHVREDVMERTYSAAFRQMTENANEVIETVREGAKLAMEPENREKLTQVEQDIVALQERVLGIHKRKIAKQVTDEEYNAVVKRYTDQIEQLQAQQKEYRSTENRYTEVQAWLNAFQKSVSGSGPATSIDALILKALVDSIIVYDDHIDVHFKCGATVEQEYIREKRASAAGG